MNSLNDLGLARALAALGDGRGALTELEPLIALWRDADPGVPVVEEGRALHARLRRAGVGPVPWAAPP